MMSKVLLEAVLLFAACLAVHVLIWRVRCTPAVTSNRRKRGRRKLPKPVQIGRAHV